MAKEHGMICPLTVKDTSEIYKAGTSWVTSYAMNIKMGGRQDIRSQINTWHAQSPKEFRFTSTGGYRSERSIRAAGWIVRVVVFSRLILQFESETGS